MELITLRLLSLCILCETVLLVGAFNADRIQRSSSEYPTPLTPANFDSYVYGHSYGVLVEFYSSYCGYCKRLAPRYAAFAQQVLEWQPVVMVAKVNCELPENLKLCRKHKSATYPTFRFFGPHREVGSDGIHIPIDDSDKLTPSKLKVIVLNKITEQLDTRNLTAIWPDIRTLTPKTEDELFASLPRKSEKPVVFILESKSAPVPRLSTQVILDMSKYKDQVTIVSVFDEVGMLTADSTDDIRVFKLVNPNTKETQLVKSFAVKSDWTETQLETNMGVFKECTKNVIKRNILAANADETKKLAPLTMVDLYNAVRHSLYHNAALRPEIDVDGIDILADYLEALVKYFPFRDDEHRVKFNKVKEWFEAQRAKKQNITIDVYDKFIESEDFAPPIRPYIKCKGSHPDLRGYPCSLWSLFHTLTVAEFKELNKTVNVDHKVLYTMRRFIGKFFTCKYCAQHFVNMTEPLTRQNLLTKPHSSVLFLWQGHNKANKRLQCDLSEDPEAPKVQFPDRTICPRCLTDKNQWNEPKVLDFLVSYYFAENIVA